MEVLLILVYLDQLDDVRMITLLQERHLPPKHIHLPHLRLPNRFDGVPRFGLAVHALPDDAVVTVTDLLRLDVILQSNVGQAVRDHDGLGLEVPTPVDLGIAEGNGAGIHHRWRNINRDRIVIVPLLRLFFGGRRVHAVRLSFEIVVLSKCK